MARTPFGSRLADCRKLVGRVGRPYYSRAHTVIQICREITSGIQKGDESVDGLTAIIESSYDVLFQAADKAFTQKTDASKEVFESVFQDMLRFCSTKMEPGVHARIEAKISKACSQDKESSRRLQSLIQRASSWKIPSSSEKIELQVYSDLPDPRKHVILMKIDADTGLEDLLFMLIVDREVKLKFTDNPHFYQDLPSLSKGNLDISKYKPIEKLDYSKIQRAQFPVLFVLKDRGDAVSLECEHLGFLRAYRNLWRHHHKSFVFREFSGSFTTLESVCSSLSAHPGCVRCCRDWGIKLSHSFEETLETRFITLTCPGSNSSAYDAETGSMDSLGTGTTAVESAMSSGEQGEDDSDNSSSSSSNTEHQDSDSASSSSVTAENTEEYHGSDNTPPSSLENTNHRTNRADPSPATPTDHPSTAKTSNPDMSHNLEPAARTNGATVGSINNSKGTPHKQQPLSAGSGHLENQGKGRSGSQLRQNHVTPPIPPLRDRSTLPPLSNTNLSGHNTFNKASVPEKTTLPSPKPRVLERARLTPDRGSPKTNLSTVNPGQRKMPPSDSTSSNTLPSNTLALNGATSVLPAGKGGDLDHDTARKKADTSHNNTSCAPSHPDVSHATPGALRDPVQRGESGRAAAGKAPQPVSQPVSQPASRAAGSSGRRPPANIPMDFSRTTSVDAFHSHGEIATPQSTGRAKQAAPAPKKKGWFATVKDMVFGR